MNDKGFLSHIAQDNPDKAFWSEISDYYATLINKGDSGEDFERFNVFKEKKDIEKIPKSKIFVKLTEIVEPTLNAHANDLHKHDKETTKKRSPVVMKKRLSIFSSLVMVVSVMGVMKLPNFILSRTSLKDLALSKKGVN